MLPPGGRNWQLIFPHLKAAFYDAGEEVLVDIIEEFGFPG
jgi:hypothetical protein